MRRLDTLFETGKLLQPYCNRADTGAYAVDTLALMDPQNPCKQRKLRTDWYGPERAISDS